jgi:hypothetical protein
MAEGSPGAGTMNSPPSGGSRRCSRRARASRRTQPRFVKSARLELCARVSLCAIDVAESKRPHLPLTWTAQRAAQNFANLWLSDDHVVVRAEAFSSDRSCR